MTGIKSFFGTRALPKALMAATLLTGHMAFAETQQLPRVEVTGKRNLAQCLAKADAKAKSFADLAASAVKDKNEKVNILIGSGAGLACLSLSFMVLGADLGALSATCVAIGTAMGTGMHLVKADDTAKEIARVHNEAFNTAQVQGYRQCATAVQ